MSRTRPLTSSVPSLASLLVVSAVAVLALAGCGDDTDEAASSTTASSTTVSTTSTTTTTTVAGSLLPPSSVERGQLSLTLGSQVSRLTITGCTSSAANAVELTATDDEGNTFTVTAKDGAGGATYRGPSQDREGKITSVQVGTDGTVDVAGIMSIADDSAPAPDQLSATGTCG